MVNRSQSQDVQVRRTQELIDTWESTLHTFRMSEAKEGGNAHLRSQIENIEQQIEQLKEIIRKFELAQGNEELDLEQEIDGLSVDLENLRIDVLVELFGFVNRKREIDLILDPYESQYILIDGPAGFGKTFLLERAVKALKSKPDTLCAMIDFAQPNVLDDSSAIINSVLNQVAPHYVVQNQTLPPFDILAGYVGRSKHITSVVFLFDSIEFLIDRSKIVHEGAPLLNWLWKDFLLPLEDRLAVRNIGLRAVFAGRYIGDSWASPSRYKLDTRLSPLRPFSRTAIQTTIQQASRDLTGTALSTSHLQILSREIYSLSGGHPRILMQILMDVATAGFAIGLDNSRSDYFFSTEYRSRVHQVYITPVVKEVLRDIKSSIARALRILSVFRRFNLQTVDKLIEQDIIDRSVSSIDTLSALVQTGIISSPSREEPFYRDNVVRALLRSELMIDEFPLYVEVNNLALKIYESWLEGNDLNGTALPNQPTDSLQISFIVEYMYHLVKKYEALNVDSDGKAQLMSELKASVAHQLRRLQSAFGSQNVPALAVQLANTMSTDNDLYEGLSTLFGEGSYQGLLIGLAENQP